ncbi:hypothetical protein PHET_10283 [Paragonimus heterotremus]|uniref:DUF4806 domain-containing protein n=1 Tax=Paragonimus heterotremus TaxID=100268 RepID=A0A8J4TAD8_9TREM|nr:hypothetical protein PHET_10283 [Paragonimus heterotremus]
MEQLKSYCLVRLEEDDREDIVIISSTWLNKSGSHAAIPLLRGRKYYEHVQQHLPPRITDPTYPVKVLITTVDFRHARDWEVQYVENLLSSNDDTIYMDLLLKRPIQPSTFFSTEDAEPLGSSTHLPPTKNIYSVPSTSNDKQSSIEVPATVDCAQPLMCCTDDMQEVKALLHKILSHLECMQPAPSFEVLSSFITTAVNGNCFCRCVICLESFHKLYLEQQNLRTMQEKMLQSMHRLMVKVTRDASGTALDLPIPVTSVTELELLERRLLEPTFHAAMVDTFKAISAPNLGALVRAMMERLMTRTVARCITYSGAQNTLAFKKTQLKAFIMGQVHERTEYSGVPDADIADFCKKWLHCARDKRTALSSSSVVGAKQISDVRTPLGLQTCHRSTIIKPENQIGGN